MTRIKIVNGVIYKRVRVRKSRQKKKDSTEKKVLDVEDNLSEPHWPQSDVLDENLAVKLQATLLSGNPVVANQVIIDDKDEAKTEKADSAHSSDVWSDLCRYYWNQITTLRTESQALGYLDEGLPHALVYIKDGHITHRIFKIRDKISHSEYPSMILP